MAGHGNWAASLPLGCTADLYIKGVQDGADSGGGGLVERMTASFQILAIYQYGQLIYSFLKVLCFMRGTYFYI